jgi:molybdopterin molybdotransferase
MSGGSSLGARDHTVAAILAQPDARILAHGVAISPGKPTIIASVGGAPVIGLPGQVTSAQVVHAVLVKPLLRRLAGVAAALSPSPPPFVAEFGAQCGRAARREDFVRVRLEAGGLRPWRSGAGQERLLKTLLAADGLLAVPAEAEGLYKGALAPVWTL